MNVLIYSGQEVLQSSLTGSLWTLRNILFPHYSVQIISPRSLATHPWAASCALLVFPSCSDLALGAAKDPIRSYVENGGKFLAFGTGAIVLRSQGDPATLGIQSLSLSTKDILRFHDDPAKIDLYPKFGNVNDRSVTVRLATGEELSGVRHTCPHGITGVEETKDALILATYGESAKPAAVKWDIGKGMVALWSPGIERALDPSDNTPTTEKSAEESRHSFLKATLNALGLNVPNESHVSRSLPLLLTSCKPGIVARIIQGLGAPSPLVEPHVFEGTDRIFNFHPYEAGEKLLQERRASSAEPPDAVDGKKMVHVVVCPDGKIPDIPVFNLERYFDVLKTVRENEGLKSDGESWGLGEVVFYGEVVSSTQSMFDLNPGFLSQLPSPIMAFASCQLSARGRGTNAWISPFGSLALSIVLRVPLSQIPMHRLVLVQYLAGLAVTEACRSDEVLGKWADGVRLKWPNDIYSLVQDERGTQRRKIGGILTNTSFEGDHCAIVCGIGLNVFRQNFLVPVTSLSQLVPSTASSSVPLLRLDHIIAAIMVKFETMWKTFLAHDGSFEPFMDLYLKRWLHTNEIVTLTTVTPPIKVRLVGITPDHGLLRTVPEQLGDNVSEKDYVDLRPDGNSFDLLKGLITMKK